MPSVFDASAPQHPSSIAFQTVFRINQDRFETEDVMQEVSIKIWFAAAQFDPRKGSSLGWLVRIARNSAICSVRARRRRGAVGSELSSTDSGLLPETPCSGPSPVDLAAHYDRVVAVRECLRGLAAARRETLMLFYFEELSCTEISARIGYPVGTLKSSMRRSLRASRPALLHHRSD